MPQEFQVLQCFSCKTFQVHQVKKSLKWACKLCGEKQSVIKVFGRGTGAECRHHVQRLNTMRGELEVTSSHLSCSRDIREDHDTDHSPWHVDPGQENQESQSLEDSVGKWDQFVEQDDVQEAGPTEDGLDHLYTTDATLVHRNNRGHKRQGYSWDPAQRKKRKTNRYPDQDSSQSFADKSDMSFESDNNSTGKPTFNSQKIVKRLTKRETQFDTGNNKWGQYIDHESEPELCESVTATDDNPLYNYNTVQHSGSSVTDDPESCTVSHLENRHYDKETSSYGSAYHKKTATRTKERYKPTAASKWTNFLNQQTDSNEEDPEMFLDNPKTLSENPNYITKQSKTSTKSWTDPDSNQENSKWNKFMDNPALDDMNFISENANQNAVKTNEAEGSSVEVCSTSRSPLKASACKNTVSSKWSSYISESYKGDTEVTGFKNIQGLKSNSSHELQKLLKWLPESSASKNQSIFSLGELSDDDLSFDV